MASSPFVAGDGFSSSERTISAPKTTIATDYTQPFSTPSTRPYQAVAIASLVPSSAAISFAGRVVNLFHFANNSQKPRAATGCLRFVLRGLDGNGLVTVRLWYADTKYPIRLGAKVAVWTTHVGMSEDGKLALAVTRLCASVFPGRDRGCHVQVMDEEGEWEDRSGEKWSRKAVKTELMTLEGFARGGSDVPDARVVACVKSIGGRKKVTRKDNSTTENVTVHLFDNTSTEATLTLWDHAAHSAAAWKPSHTVLLLTNPGHRVPNLSTSKTWLSLTSTTTLDVNPPLRDALWLRAFAARLRKRQDINPPFPAKLFESQFTTIVAKTDGNDAEGKQSNGDGATTTTAVLTPVNRILYTLASLDVFARSRPAWPLTGYLSVLLMPLNLVSLHQRHQLFSGHCSRCNHAAFANGPSTTCPSCSPFHSNTNTNGPSASLSRYSPWVDNSTPDVAEGPAEAISLRLNPRVLGPVIDETGCMASGKLVWRESAWEELFGLPSSALAALDRETLRLLEARCAWVRVSLFVGVWGECEGDEGEQQAGAGVDRRGAAGNDQGVQVTRLCVLGVRL